MHTVPAHRLAPLLRWPFLLALGLLILNDAVLKAAWHNAFTGKLSDFAGVFAFAYFWAAVIGRAHAAVHVAVAVAFVWWKSPWSAGAIEAWNALPFHDAARVVDYGDLLALCTLPLSWWALARRNPQSSWPANSIHWPKPAVAIVAVFAFTATTCVHRKEVPGDITYVSALPPAAVIERGLMQEPRHAISREAGEYAFPFKTSDCDIDADFKLSQAGEITVMQLRRFTSTNCGAEFGPAFAAMQPELRARIGARLLTPYLGRPPAQALPVTPATSEQCVEPSSPSASPP